jgi:autotransporter-associated beta strand protein
MKMKNIKISTTKLMAACLVASTGFTCRRRFAFAVVHALAVCAAWNSSFAAVVSNQPTPVDITGTLEVVQVCYPTRSEQLYHVTDEKTGKMHNLKFVVPPAEGHLTGERVRVRGHAQDGEISVPASADTTTAGMEVLAAAPAPTNGLTTKVLPKIIYSGGTATNTVVHKTLVELLLYSDYAANHYTTNDIVTFSNKVFAATGSSVNTAYLEDTYGAVGFSGDVVICSIASSSGSYNTGTWMSQGDAAATAQGYTPGNYLHKVYVTSGAGGWAGLATVGYGWAMWYYTDGGTMTHELGHNLGFYHASTQLNNTSAWVEYGDTSDFMGASYHWGHNNGPHKAQKSWVSAQTVTQPGTYTISRIEDVPATMPYPQELKFPSSTATGMKVDKWPYYLSYKQSVGFDAQDVNIPGNYDKGLNIHRWNGGNTAVIAVLSDGGSFTDPGTGWIIKQIKHDTNSVTFGMGFCTGTVAESSTVAVAGDQLAARVPVTFNIVNSTCDPLTVTNFDAVSVQNGTVTLTNRQFTYTPSGVFTGNDTFSYTAVDVFGVPSTATITITAITQPHYNWDANGAAAGTGGFGTWDILSARWDNGTNVWPGVGTSNWAFFGGTAGTVTVAAGGVTANGMLFNVDGYVVQSNTITLDGTQPTVYVQPGIGEQIYSVLAGTNGFIKSGDGTLALNAVNTYSGGTTLSAGTLALGTALPSGTLTITGGALDSLVAGLTNANNNAQNWNGDFNFVGTQDLNLGTGAVTPNASRMVTVSGGTLTVGGPIGGGAVSLTKAGSGTLQLNNTNTYSGGTVISNGTLQLGDGATRNGTVTGNTTDNDTLVIANPNGQAISGNITGAGSLTKTGTGTLTLSGTDSYSGGTTVSGGTLKLTGTTASLGSGAVINSATIEWNTDTASRTISSINAFADSGLFLKSGANNLQLQGANVSTFNGTVRVSGGLLILDTATGFESGAPNLDLTGGDLVMGNAFDSGTATFGNLSGSGQVRVDWGTATVTRSISLNQTGNTTYSGVMGYRGNGTRTLNVIKNGGGTLTLTGTNIFLGTMTVNNGTLLVNGVLTTNTTSIVTVAANATLGGAGIILGPTTVQMRGTLAPGTGGISRLTVSNSLTLAADSQTVMELSRNGGVLTNDLVFVSSTLTQGGSLAVANIGTNALVSGDNVKLFTAGTYSGGFTYLTLPPLNPNLTWNFTGLSTNGTIKVAAFTGNNAPAAPPASVTAVPVAATQIAVGWTAVSNATSYIVSRNGNAVATIVGTNYLDGGLLPPSSYCYTVTGVNNGGASSASASVCVAMPLAWDANPAVSGVQDGSGIWGSGAVNWLAGTNDIAWVDGNAVMFGLNNTTNCTVTLTDVVTPTSIIFAVAAGGDYTLADGGGALNLSGTPEITANGDAVISANIQGDGFLKDGTGTLTLSGTNTATGNVIVSAGTLKLTDPVATPGTGTVTNNATVEWNTVNANVTINNINSFAGSGLFLKSGATNLYLQGGNSSTFNGTVRVAGGLLVLDTATGFEDGAPNLDLPGGDIVLGTAFDGDTATFGNLSGSGQVRIDWGSTTATRTLSLNQTGNTTYSGVMGYLGSFAGRTLNVIKNGAGTLTLSGANIYTGTTTINGGALLVNGSVATGAVTVAAGSTLGGSGLILGATTVQSGGTLSPGVAGINRLTISNSLTLAGNTVMELNRNGGTPTNDVVFVSGTLTQGGSLIVTNIGSSLIAGDTFDLFNAGSSQGSFASVSLSMLGAGLAWDGTSLLSNGVISVIASTGANPPRAPGSITATPVVATQIDVNWSAVSNATSYIVSRDGNSIATVAGTNYLDGWLTMTTTYCYTVAAVNSGGTSVASASACATTPITGVTLTWDASPGGSAQDGSGNWGNSAANWLYGPTSFVWGDGNLAVFGVNTTTNCTVTITTDVTPSGITFAATGGGSYTLAGNSGINLSGQPVITANADATISATIKGVGGLLKTGAGALTLSGTNTSTGSATVNAGTLKLTGTVASLGSGSVTNNATVEWNTASASRVISSINTFAGSGLILKSGANNLQLQGANVSTFNGTVRVSGGILVLDTATGFDNGVPNLDLPGGDIVLGTAFDSGTATFGNLSGSGQVRMDWGATSVTRTLSLNQTGVTTYTGVIGYRAASTGRIMNVIKTGAGTLTLSATNIYTGTTAIDGGTLLVNGVLTTNAGNTVTVTVTATLGGTGLINGATTVQSGGTLAPGTGGIGTLTVSNSLVLAGGSKTVLDLSRNGGVVTNDLVFVSGTLTQGGTLTVTNIGTNALAAGDSFRLFSAATYAGAFTNLALPPLAANLAWHTNTLATNGTLAVIVSRPLVVTNATMAANRTAFTLTGTGTAGQGYVLLTATNLSAPVWLPVVTNTADSNGIFQYTDSQTTNFPQRFYRVQGN